MSSALNDYFSALERLKNNVPNVLPKNSVINKDSVALEAGRKRGSLKKSRTIFADLITAIEVEAGKQVKTRRRSEHRLNKLGSEVNEYRALYEQGLARELSLIIEIRRLKEENAILQKGVLTRIK
ncbi:hypothetical protein [Shewanella sp. Arc9-LZ]|uniref:hypothetical protein n=1 Tax=Shewanella sp. Arc9-LZ TaxID=2698686 RepID=UPI00137BAD6C|nr:hypothetical protein [Shewanella sp. Arc9-LZ]QHS14679.1 hypothetical protein GUY17_17025 [Shewanella sp. Arc9-LZ]